MFSALIIVLALAATGGGATGTWTCTNQVEVWCDAKSCTVRPPEEMTPLAVAVSPGGRFSVCAWSGCWEGTGRVRLQDGRLLLTAQDARFSGGDGKTGTDISLLIVTGDGAGFVRAGGLATPLLCRARPPQAE